MAVLGLHHCTGFSLVAASGGHSRCGLRVSHCGGFSCCRARALACMGSVVAAPQLQSTVSVVMAQGLSCSGACEIFPTQGLNPCLLHWQADSLPLRHQVSPGGVLQTTQAQLLKPLQPEYSNLIHLGQGPGILFFLNCVL